MPDEPKGPPSPGGGKLTEEMVRKLLQMNPHLRGDGKSTKDVLSVVQGQAKAGAAPLLAKPVAPAPSVDLDAEMLKISRAYDDALAELKQHETDLAAQLAQLASDEKGLAQRACDAVITAMIQLDRNLVKPEHQALLAAEQGFFSDIGFSVDRLLAAARKAPPA